MRYSSLQEVISLHSLLIAQSGGSSGLRDRGALESAAAQPSIFFTMNFAILKALANKPGLSAFCVPLVYWLFADAESEAPHSVSRFSDGNALSLYGSRRKFSELITVKVVEVERERTALSIAPIT